MSSLIQRRIEALEVSSDPAKRVVVVAALEGETNEQTLSRLGLADAGSHRLVVFLPIRRPREDVAD